MSAKTKQMQLFDGEIEQPQQQYKHAATRPGSQTDDVLKFFKKHAGARFTPLQVYLKLFAKNKKVLLTSIRRGINFLTHHGFLIKHTDKKRKEALGYTNCTWEYNTERKEIENEKDRDNDDKLSVQ
jgi:Fe2+ or Zn2+ uptake regulation protein